MAIRFIDSFDHYTPLLSKYNLTNGSISISAGNGRRGTSSLRATAATSYVQKTLDNQTTWIVGFAFRTSAFGTYNILQLMEGATSHIELGLNTLGQVTVSRNATGIFTTGTSIVLNAYNYIEFKCTINSSTGSFDIRLNGTSIGSASSQNTRNGGTGVANIIRIGGGAAATNLDYDDLFILDTSGSVNNDFLGDRKVQVLLPNATGNANVWTPSTGTGANEYQLVDESDPNDDIDYISSATPGDISTFNFSNLTGTVTIAGVQIGLYARKDDAGTRTVAPVTRSAGTDYVGSNVNLADTYAYLLSIREQDPATSAAWTQSNLNAAEFGPKLIA